MKKKFLCNFVLIVPLLAVCNQRVYPEYAKFSEAEMQILKEGKIITKKQKQNTPEGHIARVVGAIQIQKPVEDVWKCILDWGKMPQYVPTLDYYKVLETINPSISVIEGQIHVAFLKFRYTLLVKNQKDTYYQRWQLLTPSHIKDYRIHSKTQPHSSGIKNIEGFQYCIPVDNYSTILYYAPVVEVSVPVPGFVENTLTQKSIKEYLYGIKKYLDGDR